jgi:hypothetical protein
MVGHRKISIVGARASSGGVAQTAGKASTSSPKTRTNKVRSGFIAKRKYADKGIQTADIDLVTGGMCNLLNSSKSSTNRHFNILKTLSTYISSWNLD